MLKKSGPQDIGHRGGPQRQARMAAISLLHRVNGQKSDRIDRQLLQLRRAQTRFAYGVHRPLPWLASCLRPAATNWFKARPLGTVIGYADTCFFAVLFSDASKASSTYVKAVTPILGTYMLVYALLI